MLDKARSTGLEMRGRNGRGVSDAVDETSIESAPPLGYDSPRHQAMSANKAITERILSVLRPYASNWSGTLSRGDLVIPQAEVPRLIREVINAVHEIVER